MSNSDAWRGLVGIVRPAKISRTNEEVMQMLPRGVGILPMFHTISHGQMGEFTSALPAFERMIGELMTKEIDLVHAAGTPPFMVLGYENERRLVEQWQKKFDVPIFTSGPNQVRAMKALGIRNVVGIGYDFEDTSIVERYLRDAGMKVAALERLPGRWEDVGSLSSFEIYRLVKQLFLAHPDADGIYIQGGKIQMLDVVEELEQDLEVPVVHPAVATAWEIMYRLRIRQPKTGFGRLLSELPRPQA